MRRWSRFNQWAGLIVFLGFPVAVGVVTVVATAARFGVTSVAAAAGIPLLVVVALPGVLWVLYLRSSGRRHRPLRWCAALAASLFVLATSPIGLWTWPCLGVVLSELARLAVVATSPQSRRPSTRTAGTSVQNGSDR
jgi:hypothetical protein